MERRLYCRHAEGTTLKRALGTHSWAALPLTPHECGGSLGHFVKWRFEPFLEFLTGISDRLGGVKALQPNNHPPLANLFYQARPCTR